MTLAPYSLLCTREIPLSSSLSTLHSPIFAFSPILFSLQFQRLCCFSSSINSVSILTCTDPSSSSSVCHPLHVQVLGISYYTSPHSKGRGSLRSLSKHISCADTIEVVTATRRASRMSSALAQISSRTQLLISLLICRPSTTILPWTSISALSSH